jgi:hypothetical protein
MKRAERAEQRLATLSLDTEIRFRSATDRAAFSKELVEGITSLIARYHDGCAPAGRTHRLVLLAHPLLQATGTNDTPSAKQESS